MTSVLAAQVQEVWVRRYVGPNRNDRPWAIQAGPAGNVYVTGSSSTTNHSDFVTLQYAADGTLLWKAQYNSAVGASGDFASALAVDESGNVYVLGSSDNLSALPPRLTLVKYGPDGNQLWVVRYSEGEAVQPVALLVRSNAIYVAASIYSADTGWDYVTLKYDSMGNPLWAARYTGMAQSQETISGMALDPFGHVVVTGTTYSSGVAAIATLKYDPTGSPLWTNVSIGPIGAAGPVATAVATDAAGSIYIAGGVSRDGGNGDYLVTKLDPNGQELWSATYAGPLGGNDAPWAMALDTSGNVVVTGSSISSLTFLDYLTVKFDAHGNQLWAARYSGDSTYAQDTTSAIKADSEGNIYVTGYSGYGADSYAFATVKYDPNGNQIWSARYGGSEYAADLALDPQGNVYVTGHSHDAVSGDNYVTIKYRQFAVAGLPRITVPPHSLEVIAGTNAMFEVTATGNAPLHYQWRFMGALLPGETNRTLVLQHPTPAHAGDYSVIVSNAAGVTISPEARLTVFQPPEIPTAWINLLVTAGGRALVPANAIGDAPLFYQWQFNGTDLPGETNSSLLLFNLKTNNAGNYSLVVTNPYGRAEKLLATITVRLLDTLDRWYWRHPLPQGNDLRAVAYGNGRFVAVGQQGTILLSSDAVTWTNRTIDWYDLLSVAFGNGTFVAVGFGGLLTSADGEHWTKQIIPGSPYYPGDIYDVTFGNGTFVAGGNGLLISSRDGVQWQAWPEGRSFIVYTVGFGDGKFVAYSAGYTTAITSTDGVNWSTNTVQPLNLSIQSVTFGQGLFVATATGGNLFSSADGITWTERFGGLFYDVTFANGTFVAVGSDIARSTAGLDWSVVLPAGTNFLKGVTYGAGQFAVVGDHGMLLTSPDGLSWTERGGGTPNNFRGMARAPSGFFAIGNAGAVWTSANGLAWASQGSITTNNLRAISYGNETLVTVGDAGSIFTSSDGRVWTPQSVATADLYGLHFGGGQFVAVGEAGTILVSSNGINWAAALSGTAARLQGITFGQGLYVATGRSGVILTSSNAATWTARPSSTSQYLESVVASSNLFVAVGHNGAIVVSLDGRTWASRNTGLRWELESVAYAEGQFVAVGENGGVLTSNTGGDWLSRFTGCRNSLRHVIYADGAFWAAGNNETIVKSGQTRPFLLAQRTGSEFSLLIAAELGRSHRLQSSSNLADWLDRSNFTPTEELTVYRELEVNQPSRFYRVVSP